MPPRQKSLASWKTGDPPLLFDLRPGKRAARIVQTSDGGRQLRIYLSGRVVAEGAEAQRYLDCGFLADEFMPTK